MRRQFLSALLAGCLAVGCIGPVSAEEITTADGTGTVPVELTAEALTFSVTVPTSLPVGVAADGTVTTADNAEIINNSAGPVEVKSVKVEAVAPWELVGDFADLSAEKVGTDKFSFKVQGANVAADGTCAAEFDVISAKSNIDFEYNAKVAPQNEATTDEQMAKVVFTVGWEEAPPAIIGEWDVSAAGDGSIMATLTDDGVMTISGIGKMKDYSLTSTIPYYEEMKNIESVVIEDGITEIGEYAFREFTSLASIDISNSITNIGNGAFTGCTHLTFVTIPNGITNIKPFTFIGCNSLASINIPDGVTSIGTCAFKDLYNLASIAIPNTVTSIEYMAFYNCNTLTSITWNGSTYSTIDKFKTAFNAIEGNTMA